MLRSPLARQVASGSSLALGSLKAQLSLASGRGGDHVGAPWVGELSCANVETVVIGGSGHHGYWRASCKPWCSLGEA